ncbi:uncharacterized protein B0I36DRAFT_83912 [Microdochium trichocladiopsis]|uniref:ATP-grasp domain-containing protein n=1 Tax=Microdochium trichocladiopsis TaxID=1682393 RepID=A0A9P8YBD1_9PEZI|nr:uncharacterized protein B0I36DRAFT_83912 [Microdochium trichocladiopsis]KAH7034760.1 hypothetical protein B0I36DRAFT_83912 [Microdochium trichocladiopsis]
MTTSSPIRVAVLYQAIDPPVVNGVKKPMKPGGYKDSSADIAYCLSTSKPSASSASQDIAAISVVTPVAHPDVHENDDYAWCFPDTEAGILDAIAKGATHLWANTILFASHPLQTSVRIDAFAADVKVIGQPPLQVEMFDDKEVVNDMLRQQGCFTMPKGWTLCDPNTSASASSSSSSSVPSVGTASTNIDDATLRQYIASLSLPYPVVGKPIRGRGSHGVRVCHSLDEMVTHAAALFAESPRIMVEEFLEGEEGTVTVVPLPKSSDTAATATTELPAEAREGKQYSALPVVQRNNHHAGIAPYNGTVAVSTNSRAITAAEAAQDPAYALVQRECERAAELLQPTGVIRIDVRRRHRQPEIQSHSVNGDRGIHGAGPDDGDIGDPVQERFYLFDLNVKPNLTGPGRPGRDDQACLSLLAAQELGWDYGRLLREMLATAVPLDELRRRKPADLSGANTASAS